MTQCYLDIKEKTLCTGCRACEQICPKGAIVMSEDSEGFYYPAINEELCVNCDLCKKVCPVSNQPEKNAYHKLYAAQSKNKSELQTSTSGGMFITVAKEIIAKGGVVFGCIIDEDFNVLMVPAEKYEDLLPMQGSKYVQADTNDTYKQAKECLDKGRAVLYTGTPCQIAGLKKYLGKDYADLLTVDFLCHGVPSNKLFLENIRYLEKQYKGKISDYKFRDKSKKDWCMMTSFKTSKGKRKYEWGRINGYSNGFTMGWMDRLCCYKCKFVGTDRCSDITIGDFWGIKDPKNEFEMSKGVSFAMINSVKGEEMLDVIKPYMILSEKDMSEAFPQNQGSLAGNERDFQIPEKRDYIYKNIDNYDTLANGILQPTNLRNLKIKQAMPRGLVKIIRKVKQIGR